MHSDSNRLLFRWFICIFGWRCKLCGAIVHTEDTVPDAPDHVKMPPPNPCPGVDGKPCPGGRW